MDGGTIGLQIFLLVNVFVVGILVAFAIQNARAHFKPEQQVEGEKKDLPILPHETRTRIIEEAEEDYQEILHKSAVELEKNLEATTSRLSTEIDKMGDGIMRDELERYREGLEQLRQETQASIGTAQAEIKKHQEDMREKFTERQMEMDRKLSQYEGELQAKLAARNTEIEVEFQEKRAEYAKKQAEMEAQMSQRQTELEAALKERETVIAQHQADIDNEFLERQKRHAARMAEMEDKLAQEMEARRHTLSDQLDAKLGDVVAAFLAETLRHNVDLGAQLPYLTAQLEEHKEELKSEIRNAG